MRIKFNSFHSFLPLIIVLLVMVLAMALPVQAADRENFGVNNLRLGKGGPPNSFITASGLVISNSNGRTQWLSGFGHTNWNYGAASYLTVNDQAAITPTASIMIVTPTNGFSSITQTNTVAEPGVGGLGKNLWIINAGPTNILIADGATINMSGNATLGTDDILPLYGLTTNKWIQVSEEQNN